MSQLSRRSLVRGSLAGIAGSLMLPYASFASPNASPTPDPDSVYLRDTTELPDLRYMVARGFESDDSRIFPEGLTWLSCYGMVFTSEESTRGSMQAFAEGLHRYATMSSINGWEPGPLRHAQMRDLGDTSAAWTWLNTNPDSRYEWTFAVTTVVRDRWMQALWGSSEYGNPVSALADFATLTLDRWPSTTRIEIDNGMHHGGNWEMLPILADMPEGVSLAYERDEIGPYKNRYGDSA